VTSRGAVVTFLGTIASGISPPEAVATRAALLRKEGEYWTIAHAGRVIRLRHSKGLGYLERLLREPGRSFPVLALAPAPATPRDAGRCPVLAAERRRVAVTKAIRNALRKVAAHDPVLGELLQRSVRTGSACSYVPVPGGPRSWQA
jgi:hypothetical protein